MEADGRDVANRHHCLVCGFDFGQNVDREDDCPVCGEHMGFNWDDCHKSTIVENRMEWINDRNAQWEAIEYQPADWSVEKAWAQIRANVPEKFQQGKKPAYDTPALLAGVFVLTGRRPGGDIVRYNLARYRNNKEYFYGNKKK